MLYLVNVKIPPKLNSFYSLPDANKIIRKSILINIINCYLPRFMSVSDQLRLWHNLNLECRELEQLLQSNLII
uniref:Uncharacterized protein n=1 Tax=Octopus bimaculoides TaxID=37653 RepID=A0A0L8I0H6_OCTBM